MTKTIGIAFGFFFLLGACTQEVKENPTSSNTPEQKEIAVSAEFEVKTFEVNDTVNNAVLGWGYDIFKNGKRTIHQPHIPAMQGNNHFKSEADALKTGNFAANKMKETGSLPTLSLEELESLGVLNK